MHFPELLRRFYNVRAVTVTQKNDIIGHAVPDIVKQINAAIIGRDTKREHLLRRAVMQPFCQSVPFPDISFTNGDTHDRLSLPCGHIFQNCELSAMALL